MKISIQDYQDSKSDSVSPRDQGLRALHSYGEIGTYILSHLLLKLFPDEAFVKDCTYPLSIADFRWKILLPESAARLIMHDTNVDHHTAVKTMWRSGNYGTATFPHDDLDVYDEMIMEVLYIHIPDQPSDILPSVQRSLTNTAGGETAYVQSDDTYVPDPIHYPSADGPSRLPPAVPFDVPGIRGSPQPVESNSCTYATNYFQDHVRHRKLPRSMIPSILTEFEEDDSARDEDKPVLKKSRLA